ncbi:hypothetical protein ACFGOO_03170 [Treponema vincentii]|uniref:hypothetical protein n=1 Tax=Treponema vincentii TaxID=69710 RepID=UPI002064B2D4|nr:MAG TPA: hypothetical protein [Caudoviricetes sp.]
MLVAQTLQQALLTIFTEMEAASSGTPKTKEWYAEKIAHAITDQIKCAEIPAGTVVIEVAGTAKGIPNPVGIKVM